ncbi:MAG: envelope stress response membrane protein PspB [Sphingomonadales bacterium]|jgi:phage shock protein B
MDITGVFAICITMGTLFVGLPWLILHYLTKWRTQNSITKQDEVLLDELHDLARRLGDRIETVERIVAADNPNWKDRLLSDQSETRKALR